MDRLFEGADQTALVEIAVLRRNDTTSWMESRYISASDWEAVSQEYHGKVDVFFGPALRSRNASTKDAVLSSRVLWIDFDEKKLAPCPLTPTYAVSTAHGSHLYWLLDRYISPEETEELNKVLVGIIGAGADNCWNANRYLRIPNTIHGKTNTRIELKRRSNVTYTTDDIRAIGALDRKVKHKILTNDSRGYTSRSERDWDVINVLISLGMTDNAIRTIFNTMPIGIKYRESPDPQNYLDRTIRKLREKVNVISLKDGIVESRNAWWEKKGRGERQLSTFTFEPTTLLRRDQGDAMIGIIRAQGTPQVWDGAIFTRQAFQSVSAMAKQLPNVNWQWLGNDGDVRKLLPYLVEQMRTKEVHDARGVDAVGRYGPYFVLPDFCMSTTEVYRHPSGPIVLVPGAMPPPTIYHAVPCDPGKVRDALDMLVQCNIPTVSYPLMGWWLASVVKTEVEAHGYRYPVLNVFGTRGSGKTTWVQSLMRLYGYVNPTTFDSTTTRFVMLALLGCSRSLPVSLSEFRDSSGREYLSRYVRLSYDLGHDPRGRPDQTVTDYPLTTPLVIDGEDSLDDPAARERVIAVRLRQKNIDEGTSCALAFDEFSGIKTEGIGTAWIRYTLGVDMGKALKRAEGIMRTSFPERLPHRIRRNYTMVVLGLCLANSYCGFELPDIREALIESMQNVYDPATGRGKLHVDDMVEAIVNEAARKTTYFHFEYKESTNVLYFHLGTCIPWYLERVRRQNRTTLGRDALTAQLEEVAYMVDPKVIDNRWYYGVDILEASAVLDVPSKLDITTIHMTF